MVSDIIRCYPLKKQFVKLFDFIMWTMQVVAIKRKCCYCCSYCRRCYFQSVPTAAVIVVVAISKGLLLLQLLLSLLFPLNNGIVPTQ